MNKQTGRTINIFPPILRQQLSALADEKRQLIISYIYKHGEITLKQAKIILNLKSKSTAYYHLALLTSTGILQQRTKLHENRLVVSYTLTPTGRSLVEQLLNYVSSVDTRK